MPQFYFDIQDGDRRTHDDQGDDLPDIHAARDMAIGLLPTVAHDALPDGDDHLFATQVRDETGKTIIRVTLTLHTEWIK